MTGSDDGGITFCDGTVLHTSQCEVGFGHAWLACIVNLSESLHRPPCIDLSSVASLAALTLITADRPGLRDPRRVEAIQSTLLAALKTHCVRRCGRTGSAMVGRVLGQLVELRSAGRLAIDLLTSTIHAAVEPTEVDFLTRILAAADCHGGMYEMGQTIVQ